MIILLLLVVIAILLFGASSVLGAVGAIITAIFLLVLGLVFWSAGWIGAIALIAIGGVGYLVQRDKRYRAAAAKEAYRAQRVASAPLSKPVTPPHVRKAIEDNKRLDAEYRARIAERREKR